MTVEGSILPTQVEFSTRELQYARGALNAVEEIDERIFDRVKPELEQELDAHQKALGALAASLRNKNPDVEMWQTYGKLRRQSRLLYRECMAFLQGAVSRSVGLDDGLCRLGDALVDELSERANVPWRRMTVLAEEESFAELAQIIRVRFPELSVWNLPAVAHEFGHLATSELRSKVRDDRQWRVERPIQDLIGEAADQRGWDHRHELFADAFATYTLGPAYLGACVLLRFDASTATEDPPRHPSPAKRVHAMLGVLESMDQKEGFATPFASSRTKISTLWTRATAAAGTTSEIADPDRQEIETLVDRIWNVLEMQRRELRYTGMPRARELAHELGEGPAEARDDEQLADVVNAAWLARLDRWDEEAGSALAIGRRARELCDSIVADRQLERQRA
jgi:hypothetical protein